MWSRVIKLGLNKLEMNVYEQKTLILLNIIALLSATFFTIIAISTFVNLQNAIVSLIFVANTIISIAILFLNKKGHINISKYLFSWLIPIFIVIGGAYAKSMGVTNNLILYLSPRILLTIAIIIPVLFFGFKHLKNTILAIAPGVILYLFFDKIHHLFGVYLSDMKFDENAYPTYIVMLIFYLIFVISSIIFLQKVNYDAELELLEINDQLQASEEELRQQNEEIQAINDSLNETQETIIEQNLLLEQSEHKFKDLSMLLPETIFEIDAKGVFTFANVRFFEMTGYSTDDLDTGKLSIFNLFSEMDILSIDNDLEKLFAQKELKNIEYTLTTKTGKNIPLLIFVSTIEENSITAGARGVMVDITESKQRMLELRKLKQAVEQSGNMVYITNKKGIIEYANKKFYQHTGYDTNEVIGQNPRFLKSGKQPVDFYKSMWKTLLQGKEWSGEVINKKKNGELYWESSIISPISDNKGNILNFIAIKEDITEKKKTAEKLEESFKIISQQNKDITDSINYSKSIQKAVLPKETTIKENFTESFVLFKPRDVISGDFYFYKEINTPEKNCSYLAVGDCTGHGVPGAMLTMLGTSFLNELIRSETHLSPNTVLEQMRIRTKEALGQTDIEKQYGDGMELGLIAFNFKDMTAEYSGAKRPLWIIRNSNFIEIKPDKMPIGAYPKETSFTNKKITLSKGDKLYMFSDGIVDQIGGKKGRKLLTKNFKELLLETEHLEMNKQGETLKDALKIWSTGYKQMDDIIVIGIQV